MKKAKTVMQMTLPEFERRFSTDAQCRDYLMSRRWADGVTCPRCKNPNVSESKGREGSWNCYKCNPKGYRFSLLVGTIFENTNYPLPVWFKVMYLMLVSKKGISALQIQRMIGCAYNTAWYMCHRIRAGLADDGFRKLLGFVEVDETYIGGKEKNKHHDKKTRGGRGPVGKAIVVGAVSRNKGKVVARVIGNADAKTLSEFVLDTISTKVSLVATDEWRGYARLSEDGWPHEAVNHSGGQYVRGNIHTNTIEGFWSLIKRGVMGTFHKVSAKYLPLYIAEFEFRYNNRKNKDIFGAAVAMC